MTDNPITDTTAPMRLRAEPPRVTRLSRKTLAGIGAVALLGIGGAHGGDRWRFRCGSAGSGRGREA